MTQSAKLGLSLALGGGRLAYAGAAKGGSMLLLRQGATEANAVKAIAYRNTLKDVFNLGLSNKDKVMTMAKAWDKYHDYAQIIKAAGRTNKGWNLLGAYLFSAGMTDLLDDPSGQTAADQCK